VEYIRTWFLIVAWASLFRLSIYAGMVRNDFYLILAILGSFFMLKIFPAFKNGGHNDKKL